MTVFAYKDGILHADQLRLDDIAEKTGTPAYVYSESAIGQNIDSLKQALAGSFPSEDMPLIAYACKACGNLSVLALMARNDLGADIVSGGELTRALRAGIRPEKIIFSGVGKCAGEIRMALERGILQINVESKPELEKIAAIAGEMNIKAPVVLRYNPDVDAETHAKITTGREENKFGLLAADVTALYEWACAHPNLQVRGLSLHIGSQLTSLAPFRAAFEKLAELAKSLMAQGMSVECLDLGGGLGIVYENESAPSLEEYARLIKTIISPLCKQIILEPGRLLTGNAGILLASILYIKETPNRRYMILDAGMNDMMRPALYDAYHEIRPVIHPENRRSLKYDVVGPVCETGDTLGVGRNLPEMDEGDLVAVMNCGAYGASMASNYNTRPLPPEIMVRDTTFITVRQRQTVEDIINLETKMDE